jgi:hypothetical protein
MITNVPTASGLNETALKLHYRAWNSLMDIFSASPGRTHDGGDWAEEHTDYLDSAQEELQAILAIVQQSNELALKARIASVSPYLLLLSAGVSFSTRQGDIDFSNLRTLDAVDLPKAVNSICAETLSQKYLQQYNDLRIQRNQFAHLGSTTAYLAPNRMLSDLVDQYLELWPNGVWLKDRVHCAYAGRGTYFDDKNWSPRQSVMASFVDDCQAMTNGQFKRLFGITKSSLKFCCHVCRNDWAIERWGPGPSETKIAYWERRISRIHCLMCDMKYPITGSSCTQAGCKSRFVSPAAEGSGTELCFMCANEPQ